MSSQGRYATYLKVSALGRLSKMLYVDPSHLYMYLIFSVLQLYHDDFIFYMRRDYLKFANSRNVSNCLEHCFTWSDMSCELTFDIYRWNIGRW